MLDMPLGLGSGGAAREPALQPPRRGASATPTAKSSGEAGSPPHLTAPNPLYVRSRSAEGSGGGATEVEPNPLRGGAAAAGDSASSGGSKRRREGQAAASASSRAPSNAKSVGVGPDAAAAPDSDDDDRGTAAGSVLASLEASLPADRKWLHHGPYTGAETVQRSIVSDLFQGLLCSRVRCRCVLQGLVPPRSLPTPHLRCSSMAQNVRL